MTRMNTRALASFFFLAGTSSAAGLSLKAEAATGTDTETKTSAEADTSAAETAPSKPAPAASQEPIGPELPYFKRYVPEANLWELGLFGGIMLPSTSHELYEPGSPESQQGFKAAGEIGLRLAYFPLSFLGAEIEGAVMPSQAKDDSSAGLWTARGHLIAQLPGSSITPFLLAGGGALGAASDAMGDDADPALHFGLGVKAAIDEYLSVRIDLRDTLSQKFDASQGALTHHPELLVGFTFTPGRSQPDLDGDGVNDFRDACPRLAGEFDGCAAPDKDKDGVSDEADACPDVASSHPSGCPDQDQDGLEDSKDACPSEAGKAPTGCPVESCTVEDSDGDGRTDATDKCPDKAASTLDGCPTSDRDSDGIEDSKDQCPEKPESSNGFRDDDGCPDEVPTAVKKFDGVMEGISFEFGSARITQSSHANLKEIASAMKEYPSLHIEISGHTDNVGGDTENQRLSLARANAVKEFLSSEEIESNRIETKGFGPEKPIADNSTPAGQAKNRRIEFHLLKH